MKKTLFAALALVSMASCSNEEVLEVAQKEVIGFENAFVNNSTRSVNDPSKTKDAFHTTFDVYGFVNDATLFNRIPVTNTSGTWSYETPQYWINGATYNFTAIAPSTTNLVVPKDAIQQKGNISFTYTNISGEEDILFTRTTDIQGKPAGENSTIQLTFNHILSKVKFSFKNIYNVDAATIKVYDIKITNSPKKGNVVLTNDGITGAQWSWVDGNTEVATLEFGNASDSEETSDKESAVIGFGYGKTYESLNERLLIPGAVTGGYEVEFKVDLLISGTKIDTYEHTATVDFTPKAGYTYDIKAEISHSNIDPDSAQDPIQFTVFAVNGWEDENEDDYSATINTTGK